MYKADVTISNFALGRFASEGAARKRWRTQCDAWALGLKIVHGKFVLRSNGGTVAVSGWLAPPTPCTYQVAYSSARDLISSSCSSGSGGAIVVSGWLAPPTPPTLLFANEVALKSSQIVKTSG